MSMENICGILDLDGFMLKKKFYPREAGYCDITENVGKSVSIDLPFNLFSFATPKEHLTMQYVTRNIHGLKFFPQDEENPIYYERFPEIIRRWYEESRTFYCFVVGYKGGTCERDVLNELQIPCVNIEEFGCPKYDTLMEDISYHGYQSCKFHKSLYGKNSNYHCPMKETAVFCKWLRHEMFSG